MQHTTERRKAVVLYTKPWLAFMLFACPQKHTQRTPNGSKETQMPGARATKFVPYIFTENIRRASPRNQRPSPLPFHFHAHLVQTRPPSSLYTPSTPPVQTFVPPGISTRDGIFCCPQQHTYTFPLLHFLLYLSTKRQRHITIIDIISTITFDLDPSLRPQNSFLFLRKTRQR